MPLQQHDRTVENAFAISPLVALLLRMLDERWDGTLLVHDGSDEALAALLVEGGVVVAGRGSRTGSALIEHVMALCALEDAHIVEVEGTDLVGNGAGVVRAIIDPLPIVTALVRGPIRQSIVDRTIAAVGHDLLKLSPRADLGRYGFDRRELQALAALEPVPLDLVELRARCSLPGPRLHRLLCTLLATRAVSVVPAWKRISSGEIVHAPPVPAAEPAMRDDEPTKVVALNALAREQAARAARHPARRATSTHLEYLPNPMQRARITRPPSGSDRPAVPYRVCHPRSGVEVAGSTAPPPGQPKARAQSRNEADAYFRRAEWLLARGNHRGAVFVAQRAMKLAAPRPEQRALYAWLLYQRDGEGDRVQPHVWSHVERALQDDPNCAAAHYFKGALLARIGQVPDAVGHLQRALDLDPGLEQAGYELRRCRGD